MDGLEFNLACFLVRVKCMAIVNYTILHRRRYANMVYGNNEMNKIALVCFLLHLCTFATCSLRFYLPFVCTMKSKRNMYILCLAFSHNLFAFFVLLKGKLMKFMPCSFVVLILPLYHSDQDFGPLLSFRSWRDV